MKNSILNRIILLLFLIVTFSACDTNNTGGDPEPVNEYLVSYEKHKSYSATEIQSIIDSYKLLFPSLQSIVDEVQFGIEVFIINYATTFKGEEIIASGLISVPSVEGSYPVISFQNGTNTKHSDAPTAKPDDQLYMMLEFLASTGFVIAAPDYLGFGASSNMFHPYLEKESTISSLVDMLRATKEFLANYNDAKSNKDLYIMGYSQGGWSTLQLQKAIEQKYNSEFNLKASSCGAGPYDLRFVNDYILSQETYPMPYYVGYIFNSYIKTGDITNQASDLFQSPYDERIMTLFDGLHSGPEINAQLTRTMADLFTPDYLSNSSSDEKFSSIITSLDKNSISAWKTNIPMFLSHGGADSYVPVQLSDNLYKDFLAAGVDESNITYLRIEDGDHGTTVIPSMAATFNWFINIKKSN